MSDLQALQRRIRGTTDLHGVVRTMKALAAVHIRQCEESVESLGLVHETLEQGFQVVFVNAPALWRAARRAQAHHELVIVVGTDQGMCGSFNEQVATHAHSFLQTPGRRTSWLAVGERVAAHLPDTTATGEPLPGPGSVGGLTAAVRRISEVIEALQRTRGVDRVSAVYHSFADRRVALCHELLLPLDLSWMEGLAARPWQGRSLPIVNHAPEHLFSALVSEYLFFSLYRIVAESLASENMTRMRAMQAAERNIEEQLDRLQRDYHVLRQENITTEILDIASGYEALAKRQPHARSNPVPSGPRHLVPA